MSAHRARRTTPRQLGTVVVAVALLSAVGGTAHAAKAPDTLIDSGPAAASNSTSATVTFHSKPKKATFSCQLDAGAAVACDAGAITYSALTAGTHLVTVTASASGLDDPSPATWSWTVDLSAPTAPTNLAATTPKPKSVALTWTEGSDDRAVTGNDVYRDGAKVASVGAVTSFTDASPAARRTPMRWWRRTPPATPRR